MKPFIVVAVIVAAIILATSGWPPAFLVRGSFTDGMLDRLNAATVECPASVARLSSFYEGVRCTVIGGSAGEARGRIDDAARNLGADPMLPWDFDGDDLYSRVYERRGERYGIVLNTWRLGENVMVIGSMDY